MRISVCAIGSRRRASSMSCSSRYFVWSSEEECESSRTTIASTKSGPAPRRMAATSGERVRCISVKRVPSTRTDFIPKPRATSCSCDEVCCSCGTLMA